MLTLIALIVASYAIGSAPVAWLAGRLRGGVDLRDLGSGNVGASNVWQSVSKALVVPVGLAQVGQGLAGIELAKLGGESTGVQVACGLAAIAAHDWNPWLRFKGGRGVGPAIGFMLGLATFDALPAFILVSVASVPFGQSPLGVGIGLVIAPIAAYSGGEPAVVVGGCVAMTALVLAKRLLANGPPDPDVAGVWRNRLLFDRDIRDREAWVRRGLDRRRPAARG
ncbi:MAG: glycerol-3-phosphate acyltransferase [Dehalococcoidia bacterium]|nr:MAG: glycerol-3-phosphate acyltransferase [Dehalococcoidia bacterium]